MMRLRILATVALFAVAVVPLALPFWEIGRSEAWGWTNADFHRLVRLSANTLGLCLGTVMITLPMGIALAVVLFRTSFFGRRFLATLLAFLLFLPLPVLIASWQGMLDFDLRRFALERPLSVGFPAAVWIQSLSALPWAVLLVGVGLTWIEPELEEEAAQIVGPWRVLFRVTLPRAGASICAAGLFVVLQSAGEIAITDMCQVATLADEAHTQFTKHDQAGLARALVVATPMLIIAWIVVLGVISYIEKTLPPLSAPTRLPCDLSFGGWGLPGAFAWIAFGLMVIPLFGLIWKLGAVGHPARWSLASAWHYLGSEANVMGRPLIQSLATSLAAGVLCAFAALICCWLARDCRWFRVLLFGVTAAIWVLPGPVVGIALANAIQLIIQFPDGPWTWLLYSQPSPVPIVWAQSLRAFPIAVVLLWPVVRMIPEAWFEEAKLSGLDAIGTFRHVVLASCKPTLFAATMATIALCVGEIGASARVETTSWEAFTKMLFDRLHNAVDNSFAALALLMLAGIATCLGIGTIVRWLLSPEN